VDGERLGVVGTEFSDRVLLCRAELDEMHACS